MLPELFGFKPLFTRQYPVREVASVHGVRTEAFNLKDVLSTEVLADLRLRAQGNIVKAGAGVGAASGRENPEAIIRAINVDHSPAYGIFGKQSLSPRGIITYDLVQRGYAIREADITDAAATVAIDFSLPIRFRNPLARVPSEYSLPLGKFDEYNVRVECGGREQIFTGGVNTWDLSGLSLELWAKFDDRVMMAGALAGGFHLVDEFERTVPILRTQRDLIVEFEKGYIYTDFLIIQQRDNALVNDILNHVALESGGRTWFPRGTANNGVPLQRDNREEYVNSAAEVLTGLHFLNGLRDGMFSRAFEAADQKLAAVLDVTFGAGAQEILIRGRRIVPYALR